MATVYVAARNQAEVAILRGAWVILYNYLIANQSKVFAKIGWGFIQFSITGSRLIDILSILFGGKPAEVEPDTAE